MLQQWNDRVLSCCHLLAAGGGGGGGCGRGNGKSYPRPYRARVSRGGRQFRTTSGGGGRDTAVESGRGFAWEREAFNRADGYLDARFGETCLRFTTEFSASRLSRPMPLLSSSRRHGDLAEFIVRRRCCYFGGGMKCQLLQQKLN